MSDLIRREDLLEAFKDESYEDRHPIIQKFENRIQKVIKEIPGIESPKGEWVEVERRGSIRKFYKCSLCGDTCYFPNVKQSRPRGRFKYCPYCGADMRIDEQKKATAIERRLAREKEHFEVVEKNLEESR